MCCVVTVACFISWHVVDVCVIMSHLDVSKDRLGFTLSPVAGEIAEILENQAKMRLGCCCVVLAFAAVMAATSACSSGNLTGTWLGYNASQQQDGNEYQIVSTADGTSFDVVVVRGNVTWTLAEGGRASACSLS